MSPTSTPILPYPSPQKVGELPCSCVSSRFHRTVENIPVLPHRVKPDTGVGVTKRDEGFSCCSQVDRPQQQKEMERQWVKPVGFGWRVYCGKSADPSARHCHPFVLPCLQSILREKKYFPKSLKKSSTVSAICDIKDIMGRCTRPGLGCQFRVLPSIWSRFTCAVYKSGIQG